MIVVKTAEYVYDMQYKLLSQDYWYTESKSLINKEKTNFNVSVWETGVSPVTFHSNNRHDVWKQVESYIDGKAKYDWIYLFVKDGMLVNTVITTAPCTEAEIKKYCGIVNSDGSHYHYVKVSDLTEMLRDGGLTL